MSPKCHLHHLQAEREINCRSKIIFCSSSDSAGMIMTISCCITYLDAQGACITLLKIMELIWVEIEPYYRDKCGICMLWTLLPSRFTILEENSKSSKDEKWPKGFVRKRFSEPCLIFNLSYQTNVIPSQSSQTDPSSRYKKEGHFSSEWYFSFCGK